MQAMHIDLIRRQEHRSKFKCITLNKWSLSRHIQLFLSDSTLHVVAIKFVQKA